MAEEKKEDKKVGFQGLVRAVIDTITRQEDCHKEFTENILLVGESGGEDRGGALLCDDEEWGGHCAPTAGGGD
jgi:hypothetical protein